MRPDKTFISHPISLRNYEEVIKRNIGYETSQRIDDNYLESLLNGAIRATSNRISGDIDYTLNELKLYDFYSSEVRIPEGYLTNDSSIEIISDSSTLLTSYTLVNGYNNFKIVFNESVSSDPLTIKWYSGYETLDKIPQDLINGLISHMKYVHHNNIDYKELWQDLVDPYKIY